MKLFLTSQWLLPEFRDAFARLVGKPLGETKVVIIENGADDEVGEPIWVQKARASLTDADMAVTRLDLRAYIGSKDQAGLRNILKAGDVIWVGGGNVFYLNWILLDSGAGAIITELVQGGKVYAGGSAGAIVAGPTVRGFEAADDESFAPEFVAEGLYLIDVVVIPHWGRKDYGKIMADAEQQLATEGYITQTLTDTEALVVDGNQSLLI